MHQEVSPIEIDLLLLLYTFSDQYGKVDMKTAVKWSKEKLGITMDEKPFKLNQIHLNVLMDHGVIPDTREFIDRIKG